MSKLFKLKKWLTVSEAARYLSSVFSEEISEADVFRLALDGELVLSVYFVESLEGKLGQAIPRELARKVPGIPVKGVPPYEVILAQRLNDTEVIEFEGSIRHISGVIFDLPMIGGEGINCEQEYQRLTGGPFVDLTNIDGVFLHIEEVDQYVQLYETFLPKAKDGDTRNSWERSEDRVQIPLGRMPDGAVFVVKIKALTQLLSDLKDEVVEDKPLATRERTNLLNIIGALLELSGAKEAGIIGDLLAKYPEKPGIKKRTLEEKFAEAKRSLGGS